MRSEYIAPLPRIILISTLLFMGGRKQTYRDGENTLFVSPVVFQERMGLTAKQLADAERKNWIEHIVTKGFRWYNWEEQKARYLAAKINPPPILPPAGGMDAPSQKSNLSNAKLEGQVRAMELKYEMEIGTLIPAEEVEMRWTHISKMLRSAIRDIPARIATAVAAETDPTKVHILLEEALDEALDRLSNLGDNNEFEFDEFGEDEIPEEDNGFNP